MPRIGGINIIGVALATLAFYVVGFVFYGLLFVQDWMHQTLAYVGAAELDTIRQMSDERLAKAWEAKFPNVDMVTSMGLGFASILVVVIVLAILLRQLTAAAPSLLAYVGYAALMAIGLSCTAIASDHIYAAKPLFLFWVDCGYNVLGFSVAAAVLSFFD